MTGATGLSFMYQHSHWNFEKVDTSKLSKAFSGAPTNWLFQCYKEADVLVPLGIAVMSMTFSFMGLLLFYSALFVSFNIFLRIKRQWLAKMKFELLGAD